jgi:transcriptional regulator with XRE-family HTH domain
MSKPIRKTPSRALSVVSDNLRAIAEKNEWSQATLGERTGIGQRQAGRVLNQETEITLATLSDIADHLRVQEPLLLCPGMNPDVLLMQKGLRAELRHLIDALIRLDAEGNLTEQTLAFLTAGLEMVSAPKSDRDTKRLFNAK